MRRKHDQRKVEFYWLDGAIRRRVETTDGKAYTHRCTEGVFRRVLLHIESQLTGPFTLDSVADAIDEPNTQVNVALEFLKERSILVTVGRRNYIAPGYVDAFFTHAVTEYLALLAGCPPEHVQPTE